MPLSTLEITVRIDRKFTTKCWVGFHRLIRLPVLLVTCPEQIAMFHQFPDGARERRGAAASSPRRQHRGKSVEVPATFECEVTRYQTLLSLEGGSHVVGAEG